MNVHDRDKKGGGSVSRTLSVRQGGASKGRLMMTLESVLMRCRVWIARAACFRCSVSCKSWGRCGLVRVKWAARRPMGWFKYPAERLVCWRVGWSEREVPVGDFCLLASITLHASSVA